VFGITQDFFCLEVFSIESFGLLSATTVGKEVVLVVDTVVVDTVDVGIADVDIIDDSVVVDTIVIFSEFSISIEPVVTGGEIKSVQSFSSEPSKHCSTPSHILSKFIQAPYVHLNAYVGHMVDPHRTFVSSDPSMQSRNPSQMDVISMHWPDPQVYSVSSLQDFVCRFMNSLSHKTTVPNMKHEYITRLKVYVDFMTGDENNIMILTGYLRNIQLLYYGK